MTLDDRKEFIEVVLGFAELKGKQLSAPALELYWRSMQDWALTDFLAAAEQLLRTSEFMPLPKDFEDLRRAGRPTAGEAWIHVLEHARRSHQELRLEDEVANRALRAIGGIRAIAMSSTDKTTFLEKRFCEHYEQLQSVQEVRDSVPQISFAGCGKLTGPRSVAALFSGIGE